MIDDSETEPTPYRPRRLECVETGDGSRTLYDPERDAHFSSLHGARTESRHIFVEGTGIADRNGTTRVLELGFGAGINFRQTARAAVDDSGGALVYHAVDYAPIPSQDVPYESGPYAETVRSVLRGVSNASPPRARVTREVESVRLVLHPIRWEALDLGDFCADAVFYDPFGPKREPDSWSADCFEVARDHMNPSAILGTYSAASDVKRAMFRAGLSVATAPGPGPKREVTFAARTPEPLESVPSADLLSRSRYVGRPDG